jgi:hypothetical protein
MTQSSAPPESAPSESRRRSRRSVDVGLATIVGTIVTGIFTLAAVLLTIFLTRPAPSATASHPNGPATLTITPPDTGRIHLVASYSGKLSGLQLGQTVWLFDQEVSRTGRVNPTTYPDNGPCNVNLGAHTWNCSHIYIGRRTDTSSYRVCAAVLTPDQAFTVVNLLSNLYASPKSGYVYWFTSPPPYIREQSSACMSVVRNNG